MLNNAGDTLNKNFAALTEVSSSDAQTLRGETAANLQRLTESLVKTIREMVKLLKEQVDVFSEQFDKMTQTNEQKLDTMRETIEQRLGVIEDETGKKLDQVRLESTDGMQKTREEMSKIVNDFINWQRVKLPDPSHALFNEFRGLQLHSIGRDYAEQKESLDGTTDKDTFVASFSIVQHPETKDFMAYCVWPKGTLALLPRTDQIAFVQKGKEPLMADWDRVVDVVGDLMTPLDIFPQRFRVSEFPTDEQLAAMGAEPLQK